MNPRIKRLLSMLLALTLVFSLFTPITASAASTTAVDNNTVEIEVGETAKLKVSGVYSKTTWTSSDEAIATVSSNGTVTGVTPGTATITATSRNFFGFGKARVTTYTVTVVESEEYALIVKAGETLQLEVETTGGTVTWKSSDKKVATVNGKGLVTGVSEGDVTITATEKKVTGNPFFWWAGSRKTVITTTEFEVTVLPTDEQPTEPEVPTEPETPTEPEVPTEPPTEPLPTDPPETEPPVVTYTVTFESNGGSEVEAQVVEEGATATEPENPTMEGYVFEDWYLDEDWTQLYDFDAPITEDITLYAAWEEDPGDIVADDDNDGIPNAIEELFELSEETDDTDGDGIDDYTEIFEIGSDPTIDDSSEDIDKDGLSNYDEATTYGTDATLSDTDLDGLTDGEELNTYGTDPLVYDTDGDGLCDGGEIELGTDPLVANESFQVSQNNQADGDSVSASVEIELSGEQVGTLEINPVDNEVFFPEDMPGYLGMAYDFSVEGDFDTAVISFEFDSTILDNGADPAIFYFNEDDQTLEELETTIDGNIASTVVEHFSTYILIDRTVHYASFTWEDVWDTEGTYDSVEVVLVIDDSGSLGGTSNYDETTGYFASGNDPKHLRLLAARNFVDNSGDSAQIGIVKFDGEVDIMAELTNCTTEGKEALKNLLQITPCTDDSLLYESIPGIFDSCGQTAMYAGINSAFDVFSANTDGDSSILRAMIVFTDGEADDLSMHSSTIQTANNLGIRIYTVGLGSSTSYFTNYLQPLSEETNGVFYLASNADQLASIYDDISKKIDLEADADDDDIPDYYEDHMIAFNGTKIQLDKNDTDTDDDGLADSEEVEVELIYNEDGTQVYVKGKMWSDPTLQDTDYDGVKDNLESERTERMDNNFTGKMLGYYDVADADYTFDYRQFFKSKSNYNDAICSASLMLANAIYSDCGFSYDFGQEFTSITEMMEYHGFEKVIDYKLASGYNANGISVEAYTDDDISEIGIGYHEVTYNGTTKTILGIVIRGTNGTIEEWSSNFDMGDTADWESEYHKGFYITEERIKNFVSQYVASYLSEAENLTYWITGHSRGAALSNILAARLIDEGNDVFAYTFATPSTTISDSKNDSKYASIFNFANTSDFVTYVPLKEWSFGCFGVTYSLSIEDSKLEGEWSEQTGVSNYNAMNKNVITLATSRIAKSCCANWDEVHDRAGSQNIDDEQYGYISERAKRYCDLTERTSIFGNHKGYKLYPSTAFIFQLGAEMLAGSTEEQKNVKELIPELWNSKYAAVIILFLGDAVMNSDSFEGMELGQSLVGDGHAPATYYVLTHNN